MTTTTKKTNASLTHSKMMPVPEWLGKHCQYQVLERICVERKSHPLLIQFYISAFESWQHQLKLDHT